MRKLLTALAVAGLLIAPAACGTSTPAPVHSKKHPSDGGAITSMAYTQSMDDSRSCERTPGQAECAARWTIAYRDKTGTVRLAAVTETAFNDCLRRFPGGRYPDCTNGGRS